MGGVGNRRHNWKNDLFIKTMVTVSVLLVGVVFNDVRNNINDIKTDLRTLTNENKTFIIEQNNRTETIDFARRIRNHDPLVIHDLCTAIKQKAC